MIKQLKMGIKLLPYCHGVIANMVSAVAMLVIGIWMEAGTLTLQVPRTEFNAFQNFGALMILVGAMWPLQMLISLNVPGMIAASPWKKKIQTSVFSLLSGAGYLVSFLVVVALKLLKYSSGKLEYEILVVELLGLPGSILLLNVYMAFAVKYFMAATIVFCFAMSFIMNMHGIFYYFGWLNVENITVLMAIGMGILSIGISMLLDYGVTLLIYKKPVSKYSQMNSLKKKM